MPSRPTGPGLFGALRILAVVGVAALAAPSALGETHVADELPVEVDPLGPPIEVMDLHDRLGAAAASAAADPQGTVEDPGALIDPLMGGEATPPPEEGDADEPGFAAGLRAAFADHVMLAGVASLAVVTAGLAGLAFVTRYISPKEALRNPQRAMVYGYVRGHPGVHLKQLSDEFGMKTSSILWHVRKLESAQLVRSERANGFRVFYPVEGGIEMRRVSRALAALQNRNAQAIFQALDRRPAQTASDLALRIGIHGGTVRWHLRKLRDYGLVEELVGQEGSTFYGTLLGRKALATLEGHPAGQPADPAPLPAAPMPSALGSGAPPASAGSFDRARVVPIRAE